MSNSIIDCIADHFPEDEFSSKMKVDIDDLMEAYDSLKKIVSDRRKKISRDEAEDILIAIEINFIKHSEFHMNSLKTTISYLLSKLR